MKRYENALRQMCQQCKTKKVNCNKGKCNRYNAIKELIEEMREIKRGE